VTTDILDKYSSIRIQIWKDMLDPMSRANFHRLWDPASEAEKNEFFAICERASDDPVWGKAAADAIPPVRHDFTQYYRDGDVAAEVARA
jgi:hypothetical protein